MKYLYFHVLNNFFSRHQEEREKLMQQIAEEKKKQKAQADNETVAKELKIKVSVTFPTMIELFYILQMNYILIATLNFYYCK